MLFSKPAGNFYTALLFSIQDILFLPVFFGEDDCCLIMQRIKNPKLLGVRMASPEDIAAMKLMWYLAMAPGLKILLI